MTDLRQIWMQLLSQPDASRLASPDWPITVYLTSTRAGLPEFLVRSKRRLRGMDLGPAVSTTEEARNKSNDWLLSVALTDSTLVDPFLTLAVDLIEHAGQMPDEELALAQLISSLEDWRRLLVSHQPLSDAAIRGLIAELWYGFHHLTPAIGDESVVIAWKSSPTAANDFYLPNGGKHEVKSLRPGAKTIEVSSAEQLDPAAGDVTLATVELRDATAQDERSDRPILELARLVNEITARLPHEAAITFKVTLAERGFTPALDYSHIQVVPTLLTTYHVGEAFPSIRARSVPAQVSHLIYALRIPDIAGHILKSERLESVR